MFALVVLAAFCTTSFVEGLDNGLALTPPMGWMHWQRFRCVTDCEAYPDDCISEKLFRDTADRMATDGYLEAGYEYVMIDDCWASLDRDPITNRIVPDPDRFPSGIKALADYIHGKGLKFGIYGDYGTRTCAGYPGSKNYLELDAQTFAEWEVDYLKLDGCHTNYTTIDEGYIQMGMYLNKTGRPIVYSCSWPAYQEPEGMESNYTALAETCNLWRNWDDINDKWASVTSILDWFSANQDRIADFAGPGHWNDPDMLLIGNFGLSFEQSRAQMTIWSIMAAPLIMSVDLSSIETPFKNILLNKGAIRINQDALGIQGKLVLKGWKNTKIDIWTKPILPEIQGSKSYAIGLISQMTEGYPYRISFTLADLNLRHSSGYVLNDIFEPTEPKSVQIHDTIVVRIKPSGGVLLTVTPNNVKVIKV